MISSHGFPAFLLDNALNGLGNENPWSVQEAIRASVPATEKFKNICDNFLNLAILTKSSTPGEVQLKFGHSTVGNKSLGESLQAFARAGDLYTTLFRSGHLVRIINTRLTFSVEPTKWKRTDEYRYIFKIKNKVTFVDR